MKTFPFTSIQLPKPHRNWQLPEGVISPRERAESFSSIDKLLGCSLAWVLDYRAFMKPPKALDLPQKDLLLGKLAHAVIGELFTINKVWVPAEAKAKAKDLLENFFHERAGALLLPGAGPQLREAREAIPAAVEHLVQILNAAKLRVDGCELPQKSKFIDDKELAGNLDMLARTEDGTPVVLDFKWSSAPGWHKKKISDGTALQLATYAYLALSEGNISRDTDNWPPVGFFMLRGKEMFFTRDGVFPPGSYVRKQKRTLKQTWEAMEQAYKSELAAVVAGQLTARDVDHDSARIEDFMAEKLSDPPCRFCNFAYICGKEELQ